VTKSQVSRADFVPLPHGAQIMREIQELDIRIKIDSNRREELMAELAQHVANRYLFINERELWENVTRFTRASPGSDSHRYDRFMYYMGLNLSAHPNFMAEVDYERMYGKPIGVCKKMKALNDGYEQMRVEWVQISPGPGHERQDTYIDDTNTNTSTA
jgi:hypothetical protein